MCVLPPFSRLDRSGGLSVVVVVGMVMAFHPGTGGRWYVRT